MVVTKLADKIQVHEAKVKVVLRTPHRCYVFGMGGMEHTIIEKKKNRKLY